MVNYEKLNKRSVDLHRNETNTNNPYTCCSALRIVICAFKDTFLFVDENNQDACPTCKNGIMTHSPLATTIGTFFQLPPL
jgi:hypothetical protein